MGEELKNAGFHPADVNGDGVVTDEERTMYLEFKRKELEDADAQRDAKRKMAWFALFGMLLFPFFVIIAAKLALVEAITILGSMATVYYPSVSLLVATFFGADAYVNAKK